MKTFEEILRKCLDSKSTPKHQKMMQELKWSEWKEMMKQVHDQAVELCAAKVPPSQEEVSQNTSFSLAEKQGMQYVVTRASILKVKDMLK